MAKLRAGDSVGRKTRNRSKLSTPANSRPSVTAVPEVAEEGEDIKDRVTVDKVKNILAAMDGFTVSTPSAALSALPNVPQTYVSRRTRLRASMRVSGSVPPSTPALEPTPEAEPTVLEDDGKPVEIHPNTFLEAQYEDDEDEIRSQASPTIRVKEPTTPPRPPEKDEQVSPKP